MMEYAVLLALLAAVSGRYASVASPSGGAENFIISGDDADMGEIPWHASIQRYLGGHLCGAVLISDRWVLTAAHCVGEDASAYEVLVGAWDLTEFFGDPQYRYVSQVVRHPDYAAGSPLSAHDLAVVEVIEPFFLSDYIQPARLAAPWGGLTNTSCLLSGWGVTEAGELSVILKKVLQRVASQEECSSAAPGLEDHHMCVVDDRGNSATCNGDSGGPLTCSDAAGLPVVVGVASATEGNCTGGRPSYYTAIVDSHRQWIRATTGV